MSAGVASNGGRGVFQWPGRRGLGSSELSTAELVALAKHPKVPPRAQKVARLVAGYRISMKAARQQAKADRKALLPRR